MSSAWYMLISGTNATGPSRVAVRTNWTAITLSSSTRLACQRSGACVPGLVWSGYDQSVGWQPGQRLEHLFEERCDRLVRQGCPSQLAVDAGAVTMTYP